MIVSDLKIIDGHFKEVGCTLVIYGYFEGNIRAEKLMKKCGFQTYQKISVTSTAKKYPLFDSLWKLAVLLIGLPYFVTSAAVNLPVWLTTLIIRGKLKDKAFSNTVSFGVEFVLFPLIFIVGTILLFCYLPWYWAIGGSVLLYFSYRVFVDYCELCRRWISDLRWTFKTRLRKQYKALNLNKLF